MAARKALLSEQRYPSTTAFYLTPINKITQKTFEEQDELIMGRLPVFCPEAS